MEQANRSNIIHTLPLNDTKPHVVSEACECNPRVKEYPYGRLVVHTSYDKRELWENEKAQIKQ